MDGVFRHAMKRAKNMGRENAEFLIGIATAGERSAVVLGATKLDAALEELLIASLFPAAGGQDPLFEQERPLSSFGARILLSRRLGLIDDEFEAALHAIRKTRNDFAHSL